MRCLAAAAALPLLLTFAAPLNCPQKGDPCQKDIDCEACDIDIYCEGVDGPGTQPKVCKGGYSSKGCAAPLLAAGVSRHYAEAIGHSIHSLTVQDLQKFHPRATAKNGIPTVARHLERDHGIQKDAPDVPLPSGFDTEEMQVVDLLLSHLGAGDDGLGHVWSPLERVVHMFHMRDLYARIKSQTPAVLANVTQGNLDAVCPCLVDTENNGVGDKVKWIAGEYQKWMPISLHEWGSKIPKLTDKDTWQIWKKRLTFYYGKGDIRDAALYLHCVLRKFDA